MWTSWQKRNPLKKYSKSSTATKQSELKGRGIPAFLFYFAFLALEKGKLTSEMSEWDVYHV